MDTFNHKVGRTLRYLRMTANWSQVQLSMKCGITNTTISNIERGFGCNLYTLNCILEAFNITLQTFFQMAEL